MNPDVDDYVAQSARWPEEISALRPILLACGLGEELKWAKPCYSHDGANIVILQEMKDFLAAMFFKGALLDDPEGLLRAQGPNSRSARRLEFTSVAGVEAARPAIEELVAQAVAAEEAGLAVGPAPEPELVEELRSRLDGDAALAAAVRGTHAGPQARVQHAHLGGQEGRHT